MALSLSLVIRSLRSAARVDGAPGLLTARLVDPPVHGSVLLIRCVVVASDVLGLRGAALGLALAVVVAHGAGVARRVKSLSCCVVKVMELNVGLESLVCPELLGSRVLDRGVKRASLRDDKVLSGYVVQMWRDVSVSA
ncbi:hypothetical protein B0T18DRAFT_98690 [Schizothecium vesticola]|uniref:Uncharacterized protein n=1 Tax=Schizothecium vesticola TaxID=314040 RepID=A0AA40F0U1_9PEZI|nr:hypothetical protein B0T18DRAFT_98690 [Schizothecium vesticola]